MATTPTEAIAPEDPREHLNIVFIGHVDAGKSTTSGQILLQSGQVDKRIIEKYEKEAKEKNRESWYIAFIMDCSEEERERGKTVQVARAHFETEKKRYTILDAPGHRAYVPNMIAACAQADVAILLISARKGEFETGFDKGGQTREHTTLAKTLGVRRLIVAVNKMDEPTVNWSQKRFEQIQKKLSPFLKNVGYNPSKVSFVPISGLSGYNIFKQMDKSECEWWNKQNGGKCLIQALDELESIKKMRNPDAPLRIPVIDKYKDKGNVSCLGKVEQGVLSVGDKVTIMPKGVVVEVLKLTLQHAEEMSQKTVSPGENVQITLKSTDENIVSSGDVICPSPDCDNVNYKKFCDTNKSDLICPVVQKFIGQFIVLDKSMFTAGYQAMIHIHTDVEGFSIVKLLSKIDKKSGKPLPGKEGTHPKFGKTGECLTAIVELEKPVCLEKFEISPQLGRFTIREDTTVMVGKILSIKPIKTTFTNA